MCREFHIGTGGATGTAREENTVVAVRERKPPPTPKFEPKVIGDENPNFWINPDPDSRCLAVVADLSQNVVDALCCRRRSFRQVWYKLAVDCMRNAGKNVQKSDPITQ